MQSEKSNSMKKIKIDGLTKAEDLKLKVNNQKNITAEPADIKLKIEKVNQLIAEFRAKGMEIIVGQSIDGVVLVSTQIEFRPRKVFRRRLCG